MNLTVNMIITEALTTPGPVTITVTVMADAVLLTSWALEFFGGPGSSITCIHDSPAETIAWNESRIFEEIAAEMR